MNNQTILIHRRIINTRGNIKQSRIPTSVFLSRILYYWIILYRQWRLALICITFQNTQALMKQEIVYISCRGRFNSIDQSCVYYLSFFVPLASAACSSTYVGQSYANCQSKHKRESTLMKTEYKVREKTESLLMQWMKASRPDFCTV